MQHNVLTLPQIRQGPPLARQTFLGPQARASFRLHQVDLVEPVYLKGSGQRYYIQDGKDGKDANQQPRPEDVV